VRLAVCVVEPVWLAEIVIEPGARVVTVKLPVVAPAAMVIVAGTVTTVMSLLKRFTTNPLAGAGPVMVTVPVDGAGFMTVVGLRVMVESVGGFTVRDPL
jgi:hypothetical protein